MTYSIVWVAIKEDLSSSLAANKSTNGLKLLRLRLVLNLIRLIRDLVLEQSARIPPLPQHKSSISLLRLDNALLDVVMDRCLNRAHESCTHIDSLCTQVDRSSETLTITEAT